MWHKTKATHLLKIKYPIIQGPFGGRFSSVKLLSTVSNLGGLGSFGLNSFAAEEILAIGKQIKMATQKPYNLNLWVPLKDDPVYLFKQQDYDHWKKTYAPLFLEMNLNIPPMPKVSVNFEVQLESVLKLVPPVVSFIFGIPSQEVIREFKKLGTIIIATATTIEEALLIDQTPIDLILISGKEAGGHRPSFLKTAENSFSTTKELAIAVLDKVNKPVIAAGGISNGQNGWDYLNMGISALQLGTAFLATDESGATEQHKTKLLSKDSFKTELSRVYTGRLARTIINSLSSDFNELPQAPYPIQSQLFGPLIKKYKDHGLVDKIPFWAGEQSSVLTEHSAQSLFNNLIKTIDQLASNKK